jgi:hypothetical protein
MSVAEARRFLLGMYHDLPNVLFIGCLILGSITGYLPLVWLALGLILNGSLVAFVQSLLKFLFPTWAQISIPAGFGTCTIIPNSTLKPSDIISVAPSHWLAAAVFFATFSIWNSIQVALREPANGVNSEKVANRRASSMSAMVIGIVFFALVLARGYSGCETWLGGILGIIIGSSTAIGYWYLLDACGTGTIPDILQLVSASAPAADVNEKVPIICTP